MKLNTTILGDCIEEMQNIEEGSVDLVVADPPYWKVVGEKWDYQWRTELDSFSIRVHTLKIAFQRTKKGLPSSPN